jgi:peptidyl-prolyl cis-trans isomerase-like 4
MAVMLETSKGDMVLDLFVEDCPLTAKNFLKLCKYVRVALPAHS